MSRYEDGLREDLRAYLAVRQMPFYEEVPLSPQLGRGSDMLGIAAPEARVLTNEKRAILVQARPQP